MSRALYLLSSLVYPQHLEESLTGNRNSGSFAEWMQTQMDARGDGWGTALYRVFQL